MRICFVTTEYALHPPYGGIATYTRDAARWLDSHGHTVHVVLVSRGGPHRTEEDAGVMVHTVPPQRIKPRRVLKYAGRTAGLSFLQEAYAGWNLLENSIGAWKAVDRLSTRSLFDVVEVADWSGLGFWGTFRPRRPRPILIRSHGYFNPNLPGWDWAGGRFQLALERYSIQHADFVLAASAERVDHYMALFGLKSSKIADLPYGLSIPQPPPPDRPVAQSESMTTVLYIGRVELRKACDVLLDALRIVHKRQPSIRVVFVGSVAADMKHEFAAFLEETTAWVEYAGVVPQEQVIGYLRRGDMIVLPSRFETLPRVLIEALAAGVPQIASAANGIPEIVEHGITGFVVDPITPEAFAEAIVRLSSSPDLRASMSQRSCERAMVKFEINRVMKKQVQVYGALAAGELPLEVLRG